MTALDELLAGVGARIAKDLAEQAARHPHDAAREAGCTSDAQTAAWLARHRPSCLPPQERRPAAG